MLPNLSKYTLVLASKSPRRQQLLKDLGVEFSVFTKEDIEEKYPEDLEAEEIAVYLAELKAQGYTPDIKQNELYITADTIVYHNHKVVHKPQTYNEAFEMLQSLSGELHKVITGVCIKSNSKHISFSSITKVHLKELENDEITYYLDNYKPYDKAGAYGIQEWLGLIGIDYIEGSYFNVMGLPVNSLYKALKEEF